jgi:hypothetical protein
MDMSKAAARDPEQAPKVPSFPVDARVYILDLCSPAECAVQGTLGTWSSSLARYTVAIGASYLQGRARALELWRDPAGELSPAESTSVRKIVFPEIKKALRRMGRYGPPFHTIRLRKSGELPFFPISSGMSVVRILDGEEPGT